MTSQAKHLKALLKKHGIADAQGRLRVRTGRMGGTWGNAAAHVRALTPDEIAALKADDKYVEISNHPAAHFAIIRW